MMGRGPRVVHGTAEVQPGVRLHAVEAGEGPRTIVLLHGYPQTWWEWRHVIAPLAAAGWRVIAPDYRGAGASSKPQEGYDKRTMATDILWLLREHCGVARARADITRRQAVAAVIAAQRPRLVVNAAAYTAVDRAESEPERAHAANAVGAGILADEAARAGAAILHLSTGYVFDGTKNGAYDEADPIAPLGVYGRSKAEGERAVREANPCHVILRTAWVYGCYGGNFLKTMMRLAVERDRLRVVADQRGCPTATADIARAILAVDAALLRGGGRTPAPAGTFHFAGSGVTSWHGFAQAIVAAQARFTGREPPVDAIGTADYPTPARRPANSELCSDRFAQLFGYRASPWQQRTQEAVAILAGSARSAAESQTGHS